MLLATSDAPVYFYGPVKIGEEFYVDGGVGGNCPLKQVSVERWDSYTFLGNHEIGCPILLL